MRVLTQRSSPRVQHAGEAELAGADVLGIFGQLAQRGRGRLEHRPVAFARMRSYEPPQLLRHGERDQEVWARQEFFQLLVEPLLGLVPLALRTVTVAARLRHHVITATRIAAIQGRSELPRATALQHLHHAPLVAAHAIGELRAIRRAILTKDVADRRRRAAAFHTTFRLRPSHRELIVTHGPPADRS